jgi:DNA-binding transcriptional regulator YbjK
MVEALWSAEELYNLGHAVKDLQDTLQEWEQQHNIKIDALMVKIERQDRPVEILGLVSLLTKTDTVLQFEAGDYEIGLQ